MECFPFSALRIFSLSIPLCEWLTSTPFLLLVYYLFFCWIFAVALVWCLRTKFHKWLLDFICHHILHQYSRSWDLTGRLDWSTYLTGRLAWSRTYLTGRLAWSRRNTVGVGPTPYKWFLPELDLHLSREWATLAPFSRNSGVGHSGLWPPLHCGDSKHLHRRLFQVPHCTLRLSHLSVGGNARGPEIVSQLDM